MSGFLDRDKDWDSMHASFDENQAQYEVELFWVHSTDSAILVATTDEIDAEEVWLPKSAIAFERKGVKVTVWAPEKMLVDKGLV